MKNILVCIIKSIGFMTGIRDMSSFEKAVKEAEVYVLNGIENTYAVISEFETDCDYTEDEIVV